MTARIRILEAAERLFAENGIEAVSLRQIAAAAGQRNTSAVAYHYGSRAALVAAVYEWRMTVVNARRLELLAEIGESGGGGDAEGAGNRDVTALVRAFVEPLAATLADAESGGEPTFYLRFMAETMRYPEYDPAVVTIERPEAESIRELIGLIRKTPAASRVPQEVFFERMRLLALLVATSLADRERRTQDPGRPGTLPAIATEVVVNAGAAIMSAPWP